MTWDRLHADSRRLAALLLPLGPWRGLVGVSRGGLVPAAIIARELECRLVESVCVTTYDEETRGTPHVLKSPVAAGDGEGFLIIDDLVDRGTTAEVVRALLPRAHFACLYAKPAGAAMADTWLEAVPQDTWILFPWDTAPAFVAPLARGSS